MKAIRLFPPAAIAALLFLAPPAATQSLLLPGGRGLIHLASAWNLDRGVVQVYSYGSTYFKNDVVSTPTGESIGTTFWDIQGALSVNYASGQHLQWAATQIVYQDNHKGGKGYNLPDDLFLGLKIGSLGSIASPFRFGLQLESRIPLANKHNVVLEPYSSGRVEAGFAGMISYSPDLLIPENAFNLHANLGYWFHNDAGQHIAGATVLSPSREVFYGMGFAVPSQQFDFSLELTGRAFVQRPPQTAFTRNDYIFLTPGVAYRPYKTLLLQLGVDMRLTSPPSQSSAAVTLPSPDFPRYAPWRVRLGMKFQFGRTSPELPPETQLTQFDQNDEQSAFEQLAVERRRTQQAARELERIRMQREQLQVVLARLRRVLDYGTVTTDEKEGKSEVTQKNP